jgi:hypothetical protein
MTPRKLYIAMVILKGYSSVKSWFLRAHFQSHDSTVLIVRQMQDAGLTMVSQSIQRSL